MSVGAGRSPRVQLGPCARLKTEAGAGRSRKPASDGERHRVQRHRHPGGAGERNAGDGAWADYLLTAAGLTLVSAALLLLLVRQAAPLEEAGRQAELTVQAEGFQACIAQVSGSVLYASAQFQFSGEVDEVTVSGEDVALGGGGVRCTYPLALRVYVFPMDVNGTVIYDTSGLRGVLNVTCGATGESGSPLSSGCREWLRDELRRNAVNLALSPAALDPTRPVLVEKVRFSCTGNGEVSAHVILVVHQ